MDRDLGRLLAAQRVAIALRRGELELLEAELIDLELTIDAAGRARTAGGGTVVSDRPIRVLFVCTGNSARSQIGEALLEHCGGPDFEVESAGTEPRGVSPFALRVLAETGIDWTGARSKSVDEFVGRSFDYVITVCDRARQSCPVFPGTANTLHWGLDDPADAGGTDDEKVEAFRRTALELTVRLRPFIEIARRSAGRPVRAAATS